MFLALNEQQLMLQEAAERMAADRASPQPEALQAGADKLWIDFVETEFLALGLPESVGGAGGDLTEICLVVEAAAYYGLVTPHISAIVLGARLLGRLAPDYARARMAEITADAVRIGLAHSEHFDVNPARPSLVATQTSTGWRLKGAKTMSLGAPAATHLLISATSPGGVSVFMVDANQTGVGLTAYKTQRGESAADLLIDCEVPADSLVTDGVAASQALATAFDEAVTVMCWEALGAMRALVERTAEHLRVRHQFGAPLAKLQVLRHRVAEMKVAYEDSRAIAGLAMLKASGSEGARFASAAKAHMTPAARAVAAQAVQLHGAMGVTEETLVSTYFRRLTAFEQILGSRDYHCRRYADAAFSDGLHWKSAVLS